MRISNKFELGLVLSIIMMFANHVSPNAKVFSISKNPIQQTAIATLIYATPPVIVYYALSDDE